MSDNDARVPENALFVCFGCMSNVGTLTGLAGLEAIKRLAPGKAGIFCLGGLATDVSTVFEKTRAAKRIITVDGCPMNCAQKIVERAGFTPYRTINLVKDANIPKQPPSQVSHEYMERATQTILAAIKDEGMDHS